MFIRVTAINGHTKQVTIGIQYIVLVEPYNEPGEPTIHAIITLPGRVLYVAESYEQIDAQLPVQSH